MTAAAPHFDLSLSAAPSSVRQARDAVAEAARQLDLPARVVNDIRLCVSEAVTNAVRHAYPNDPGVVHLTVEPLGTGVLVVVRDFGSGEEKRSARPRDSGGFGWRIVERLTDRLNVRSSSGHGTEVAMAFGVHRGHGP